MLLREFVRLLVEDPGTPSFTSDPTKKDKVVPDDVEREESPDWNSFPGQSPGSSGDPGRPEDALSYLGMSSDSVPSGEESETPSKNQSIEVS